MVKKTLVVGLLLSLVPSGAFAANPPPPRVAEVAHDLGQKGVFLGAYRGQKVTAKGNVKHSFDHGKVTAAADGGIIKVTSKRVASFAPGDGLSRDEKKLTGYTLGLGRQLDVDHFERGSIVREKVYFKGAADEGIPPMLGMNLVPLEGPPVPVFAPKAVLGVNLPGQLLSVRDAVTGEFLNGPPRPFQTLHYTFVNGRQRSGSAMQFTTRVSDTFVKDRWGNATTVLAQTIVKPTHDNPEGVSFRWVTDRGAAAK
jgi:hypothetical protein